MSTLRQIPYTTLPMQLLWRLLLRRPPHPRNPQLPRTMESKTPTGQSTNPNPELGQAARIQIHSSLHAAISKNILVQQNRTQTPAYRNTPCFRRRFNILPVHRSCIARNPNSVSGVNNLLCFVLFVT